MPEKSIADCPVGLGDDRTGNGSVLVHLPEKFYNPVSLVIWGVRSSGTGNTEKGEKARGSRGDAEGVGWAQG